MTATVDTVIELVRETLGMPADEPLRGDQLLFIDLAFTSLDLLDLLFRIEERFGVAVPEGTMYRLARGEVTDERFAAHSHLTPLGRERLMAMLHETPPATFPDKIHAQTLPRYASIAAMARLVDHLLAERG
jgi:acyl carrier protein